MAHNSKRWLVVEDYAHGGRRRLKRSRHRTRDDRMGILMRARRGDYTSVAGYGASHRWSERAQRYVYTGCPACVERATTLRHHFVRWSWCPRCEDIRRRVWDHRTWRAPKWFRQQIERDRRAQYRHLLRTGRYDDIPTRYPQDAAYAYW